MCFINRCFWSGVEPQLLQQILPLQKTFWVNCLVAFSRRDHIQALRTETASQRHCRNNCMLLNYIYFYIYSLQIRDSWLWFLIHLLIVIFIKLCFMLMWLWLSTNPYKGSALHRSKVTFIWSALQSDISKCRLIPACYVFKNKYYNYIPARQSVERNIPVLLPVSFNCYNIRHHLRQHEADVTEYHANILFLLVSV